MYCVRCGKKAAEQQSYCLGCGMRLITPKQLEALLNGDTTKPKSKQKTKIIKEPVKQGSTGLKNKVQSNVKTGLNGTERALKSAARAADSTVKQLVNGIKAQDKKEHRRKARTAEVRKKTVIPKHSPRKAALPKNHRPAGRQAAKTTVKRRKKQSFTQRHLRTIIATALLCVFILSLTVWGCATKPGKRLLAHIGIGSASGYILLGDDCLEDGNNARAVEYYYKALTKHITSEAALKLALAFQKTGNTEKETEALLLCADNFPDEEQAYVRLIELYPDESSRPEIVERILNERLN